jgi:hypothetical protein
VRGNYPSFDRGRQTYLSSILPEIAAPWLREKNIQPSEALWSYLAGNIHSREAGGSRRWKEKKIGEYVDSYFKSLPTEKGEILSMEPLPPDPSALLLTPSPQSIELIQKIDERLVDFFLGHPSDLKSMNRRLFEELIAELWAGFGYEVELTQQTRDGGKDIIAVRNTLFAERILIECKRPDPGNKIGVQLVRSLYGVKVSEGATKAIMATTSYFSPESEQWFAQHKWELEGKDFDGVQDWLKRYLGKALPIIGEQEQ